MKHFVTADDVRRLAESGERELMLREHTVLTDARGRRRRSARIRLVEGSSYATKRPRRRCPVPRPARAVSPARARRPDTQTPLPAR